MAYERATQKSHSQATRVFGNMSHQDFERIAGHLEPPYSDEKAIVLDGTQITREYVIEKVGIWAANEDYPLVMTRCRSHTIRRAEGQLVLQNLESDFVHGLSMKTMLSAHWLAGRPRVILEQYLEKN